METFLSQVSSSEVYPSDISFIHRSLAAPEHYGNSHFASSTYSRHPAVTGVDGKFRCEIVEPVYTRGSSNFFSNFDSDREDHQSELSQSFATSADFDVIDNQSLNDAHFDNQKIEHPSLRIDLTDEAPQLSYEGTVTEEAENQYSSSASISRSPSEEQIDSSCPILIQESPYVTVPGRLSGDPHSSSCPLLNQEATYLQVANTHASNDHSQPSTSTGIRKWNGENPLQRFSVLVGHKKLNFRVCDRSPSCYSRMNGINSEAYAMSDNVIFKGNKCFVCGMTFATKPRLREHQMTHSGAKPIPCSFCGRIFYHKTSLQTHERIHTGEKPFQCPICTKCFARQTNYNIHMKLHASGRRYFCSFCGKWFRSENEMLGHQQQCLARMQGVAVNSERPLRYQCSFCEKMFHHRRDKNIHERTHTGERPYSCGYCGKGFTQSQALTIHIRTHTGERPYSCAICAKDFRDSSALRKHEFIKHTNMRMPNSSYSSLNDMVLMSIPSLLNPDRLQVSD